jgi:hypothetical protein
MKSKTGARTGRPMAYPMGATQKSFTLDARLVRRLEEREGSNLSQTVNDLLQAALDQEDMLAAATEMAAAYETTIDPEVAARAAGFFRSVRPRGAKQ